MWKNQSNGWLIIRAFGPGVNAPGAKRRHAAASQNENGGE
jgi:hypothetical protein